MVSITVRKVVEALRHSISGSVSHLIDYLFRYSGVPRWILNANWRVNSHHSGIGLVGRLVLFPVTVV